MAARKAQSNGVARAPARVAQETQENIFLFIPNLIGKSEAL